MATALPSISRPSIDQFRGRGNCAGFGGVLGPRSGKGARFRGRSVATGRGWRRGSRAPPRRQVSVEEAQQELTDQRDCEADEGGYDAVAQRCAEARRDAREHPQRRVVVVIVWRHVGAPVSWRYWRSAQVSTRETAAETSSESSTRKIFTSASR